MSDKKSARATTFALLQAIKWQSRDWLWATEVQFKDWNSTGEFFGAPYYIDFLRIQPGRYMHIDAFEIKASRADLLKELKTPKKHADAVKWSDQFWFLTPKGLADPKELPEYAGLIEWDGRALRRKKSAPFIAKAPAEWRIIVNILKHSNAMYGEARAFNQLKQMQWRIDALENGQPDDNELWNLRREVEHLRDVNNFACAQIKEDNFRLKLENKKLRDENLRLKNGGESDLKQEYIDLRLKYRELEDKLKKCEANENQRQF